jgi:site-specific recombinase XerD
MSLLEISDVDPVNRQIKVRFGKGAKQRIVGFGAAAKKALMEFYRLRQQRAKSGVSSLWITEEGNRLTYWGIGGAIYDYKNLAGIEINRTTHALRHTLHGILTERRQ